MATNQRIRFPLSVRFFLVIFLIILTQGATLFYVTLNQIKADLTQEKQYDIRLAISTFNQNLASDLRKGKAFLIEEKLQILRSNGDISSAYILSKDNIILDSFQKSDIGRPIQEILSLRDYDLLQERLKQKDTVSPPPFELWHDEQERKISATTSSSMANTSYLFLQIDMVEAEENALKQLLMAFIPVSFVLLLTGILLAIYFRGIVSKRIQILHAAAHHFTEHGSTQLPENTRNDELNDLKDALSHLMETVNAQHTQLSAREQDLSVILNSIGDAVIATDTKGNITLMNPIAEHLTGWRNSQAKGKAIDDVLSLIDANTKLPLVHPEKMVLSSGNQTAEDNEFILESSYEWEYRISLSVFPILDEDKSTIGAVLAFKDITAQYELQQEANQDKKLMQAMMDNSPAVIYIRDTQGQITFVNKQFEILFDLKLDLIKDRSLNEILPEHISEALCLNDKEVLDREEAITYEEQFEQNGIAYKYLSVKFPIIDENNKCVAVCTISNNINKIWELQQKLAQHMRDTPLGAIEWNKDHRVVEWNPAAERIFGYTREEALGKHANFILSNELWEQVNPLWKQLTDAKQGDHRLNENVTKYGTKIICDWFNTPLVNQTGETIGIASFISDVSSQQRALRTLVKKEREQREILNSMTNGVITLDEDDTILTFNQAASALFGYKEKEMIGNRFSSIFTEQQYQPNQLMNRSSEISGQETLARHKNGTEIPVFISTSELPTDSDEKKRFIASFHDLRKQKEQAEILRRTQKMESLGLLTGGIAHDFNNILGVVRGYADMLAKDLKDKPKLDSYAQEIKQASIRGAKLTEKLLGSTKKKRAQEEVANINEILTQQRSMLEKSVSPSVKFSFELQADLWPTLLDSSDLEDAVLNLCVNADHAMQNGGTLLIFTYNNEVDQALSKTLNIPAGDYVTLCVTDTGEGIEKETLERIFDPFYSTKGDKGTGLGLSQIFGFVQRSGGAIKVDSTPGYGSQFSIYFPRHQGFDKAASTASSVAIANTQSTPTSTKGQESILVVDDEEALRSLCVEVLSDAGYTVLSAESAEDALEILKGQPVDLLLSDVVMPGMNGYELAEEAKAIHPNIKIQLASGFDANHFDQYGDQKLRENMIAKPYSPFILLRQIRAVFDN